MGQDCRESPAFLLFRYFSTKYNEISGETKFHCDIAKFRCDIPKFRRDIAKFRRDIAK